MTTLKTAPVISEFCNTEINRQGEVEVWEKGGMKFYAHPFYSQAGLDLLAEMLERNRQFPDTAHLIRCAYNRQ